ncbi:MAG: site-specific integrase [Formivibrio sp.]|nr:site-specific integrase [Formivibrio sp.]
MARNSLPFLLRRGDTFAFRLRVPQHLRPVLGCREIVRSLKTQNKQEAAPLALVWAGKVKTIFAACESMTRPITAAALKRLLTYDDPAKAVTELLPLLERSESDDIDLAETGLDESDRADFQNLLNGVTVSELNQLVDHADRIAPPAPLAPLAPHRPISGNTIEELSRNAKAHYKEKREKELQRKKDETDEAKQEKQKRIIAAIDRIRSRFAVQNAEIATLRETNDVLAKAVSSPSMPPKPKKTVSLTWEDLIQKWIVARKPAETSISGYRSSVNAFTTLFPDLKIEDLQPHHFEEYRAKRAEGFSKLKSVLGTTIQKDESFFTTLLGYAVKAKCIDKIPLSELDPIKLEQGDEKEVRPYTDSEIQIVFNSPIYTADHTPISSVQEGRGHFWLPILMAYTGARIEELCQLIAAQVDEHEGTHCLLIYPSRTRIKNNHSRRFVPLHDELLKLGFADHVARLRKEHGSQAPLFPGLKIKPSTGKVADAFSKWFDRHVVKLGIQKKVMTKLQTEEHLHACHSLRTTFINNMRSAEGNYRKDLERLIVGHEGEDVHDQNYDGAAMAALKRLIDTVQYPGVNLSRHYNRREL